MKVVGWVKSKQGTIFAVTVTILFMCVVLVVQDIKNSTRELKLYQEQEFLLNEMGELEEFSDFIDEINYSLRAKNEKQALGLQEAASILNHQSAIIQKLVEYLKSINEWPPKIAPPSPVDPSKLARNRSEA